jgi:hypothetical protein
MSVVTRKAIMTSSALAVMVMTKGTKDNNDKDDEPCGESTAARLLEANTCIAGSGSTI